MRKDRQQQADHRVLALARQPDLRFDRMTRNGPVFHTLSSLDELGRMGFTAIADSADDARRLYEHVQRTLISRARAVDSSPLSHRRRAGIGVRRVELAA